MRMVSVLFRPERARQPRYLSFRECMGYEEDPIRRDMRPSFPYIFELGRLAVNYKLERLPTVGRNSHVGNEWSTLYSIYFGPHACLFMLAVVGMVGGGIVYRERESSTRFDFLI